MKVTIEELEQSMKENSKMDNQVKEELEKSMKNSKLFIMLT